MSETILKVDNIAKQYRLGTVGTGTIGHDLNRWWHKVRGKEDPYLKVGAINDRSAQASSDYVWALRDISFEVKTGEVLGIIGKNGAGKSTLLKILSRVTSPTLGSIKTKGRIASLLEVGTGMHPELTGRENVYLNGAILGMTKAEIRAKIDEIVEFSGCQMYIDTPVKRYSSGMRVRLGFAVAAFLEPDILVVDEVLAVGDADFQKKAIGKMQDISTGGGRTVLFVSHNMASIQQLCDRVVVLKNGGVSIDTKDVNDGIQHYLQHNSQNLTSNLEHREDRKGNGNIKFTAAHIYNQNDDIIESIVSGIDIRIKLGCKVVEPLVSNNVKVAIAVKRSNESVLSTFYNELTDEAISVNKEISEFEAICTIPAFPFSSGLYKCNISIKVDGQMEDWIENAFEIAVEDGDFFHTGRVIPKSHQGILLPHNWTINAT
ncbi:MAG: ABC transporter ATP-binding protein [Dokdonia sp.]|jgi:lipopolysaccharide transport system ATP-binding protein